MPVEYIGHPRLGPPLPDARSGPKIKRTVTKVCNVPDSANPDNDRRDIYVETIEPRNKSLARLLGLVKTDFVVTVFDNRSGPHEAGDPQYTATISTRNRSRRATMAGYEAIMTARVNAQNAKARKVRS